MTKHPSLSKRLALLIALAGLALAAAAQEPASLGAPEAAPPRSAAEATPQVAAPAAPQSAPSTAATTGKRPRAEVAEPVAELGDVTYGDTRTHEFVIRNTGDDVLRIHAAKSNCGCTVLEFTPEIAPGAEGKVTARFDAQLEGGAVAVPIETITNDPENPQLRLTIKAFVRYFVQAVPGFVRYVVVQDFDGDSVVAQTLWSTDGQPMRITKVESPYDFVEATFREARAEESVAEAKGQQQWRVETRIQPTAPVGPLSGLLTIHVDHPAQKIVKLPVHGFVRPMFAVTPPTADVGNRVMKPTGLTTSLQVKNFAEELVKVTAAETSVAGITAAIEEVEPGRIYWVKLTFAPDLPKGKFSGVVRIKTESPKKPLIEVPLRGTIS